jgi:hypothetical protein
MLGKAGINITAFTVSENSDFGILRLIVSDPEEARRILKAELYAVSMADVVCLECPNEPGSLGRAMTFLTGAGVFVEYMYAFATGPVARVIIRPDSIERCVEVLKSNKLELLAASELYRL